MTWSSLGVKPINKNQKHSSNNVSESSKKIQDKTLTLLANTKVFWKKIKNV